MLDKKYKCDKCKREVKKRNIIEIYTKYDGSLRKRYELCENCYTFVENFIKYDGGTNK